MILYKTVFEEASSEQIIKKSKFITHIKPVNTREEAEEFFEKIRKEYRDATHNVPAMIIGDKFQLQWASDDGEPQGTSGTPIIQLLVQKEITNVATVVTRYFGGIKLGPGGLVRAYTSSVQQALDEAKICAVKQMKVTNYTVDYPSFNKINSYRFGGNISINNVSYAENVSFDIICDDEEEKEAEKCIMGLSNGKCIRNSCTENECKVLL